MRQKVRRQREVQREKGQDRLRLLMPALHATNSAQGRYELSLKFTSRPILLTHSCTYGIFQRDVALIGLPGQPGRCAVRMDPVSLSRNGQDHATTHRPSQEPAFARENPEKRENAAVRNLTCIGRLGETHRTS